MFLRILFGAWPSLGVPEMWLVNWYVICRQELLTPLLISWWPWVLIVMMPSHIRLILLNLVSKFNIHNLFNWIFCHTQIIKIKVLFRATCKIFSGNCLVFGFGFFLAYSMALWRKISSRTHSMLDWVCLYRSLATLHESCCYHNICVTCNYYKCLLCNYSKNYLGKRRSFWTKWTPK